MSIKFSLSTKKNAVITEIRVTVHTRQTSRHTGTGIMIDPKYWDAARQCVIEPRFKLASAEQRQLCAELREKDRRLADIKRKIEDAVNDAKYSGRGELTAADLNELVHGEQCGQSEETTTTTIGLYTRMQEAVRVVYNMRDVSDGRLKRVQNVINKLELYEVSRKRPMTIGNCTPEMLADFEKYLLTELKSDTRRNHRNNNSVGIGKNTVNTDLKLLKSVFNYCERNGIIDKSPFVQFELPKAVYADPIFLTQSELAAIEGADFGVFVAYIKQSLKERMKKGEIKAMPSEKQIEGFAKLLEEKRDIFVFQCRVGCRVGDLLKLTKRNVTEGSDGAYLHYIAEKTAKTSARTINVPLHDGALAIVRKYAGRDGVRLLPFISAQKYNNEIKRVFEAVGITRSVTILDAATQTPKQVRICDVASSHMARKTFCGTMFNEGVDSSIICAMSGHTEGSKAFARYHNVDMSLMRTAINRI
jgi:integrase